jgi:hypothetical protein
MLGCGNWVYSLSVSLFASFTWMTKISEFKISWQIALKGCQFSVHFPVTFSLHLCIPYTVLFLLDFLCKTHDTRPLLTLLFTSPWNLSIPGFYLQPHWIFVNTFVTRNVSILPFICEKSWSGNFEICSHMKQ